MKLSMMALAVASLVAAPAVHARAYTVEAPVLDVKPVYERVPSSRDRCWTEQVKVVEQRPRTTVSGYTYMEDVTITRDIPRCESVTEDREARTGYDVRYAYNGREYTMRMTQPPGRTVKVHVDEPG